MERASPQERDLGVDGVSVHVRVHPGDVVVADGDGVIVVPRKMAVDVAKYAHQELANDKAGRRRIYEEIGMELDETVL